MNFYIYGNYFYNNDFQTPFTPISEGILNLHHLMVLLTFISLQINNFKVYFFRFLIMLFFNFLEQFQTNIFLKISYLMSYQLLDFFITNYSFILLLLIFFFIININFLKYFIKLLIDYLNQKNFIIKSSNAKVVSSHKYNMKKNCTSLFQIKNRNFSSTTNESIFLTDSDKHQVYEMNKTLISLERELLCKLNLLDRGNKNYKDDLELIFKSDVNKVIETAAFGHIGFNYTHISLELKDKAFLKALQGLEEGQKLCIINFFDDDYDVLSFLRYSNSNRLPENCDLKKHLKIDYDLIKNKRMFSEDELLKHARLIAEFRDILVDLLLDTKWILRDILYVKKQIAYILKIDNNILFRDLDVSGNQGNLELNEKTYLNSLEHIKSGQKKILLDPLDKSLESLVFLRNIRLKNLSSDCDIQQSVKEDFEFLKNKNVCSIEDILKYDYLFIQIKSTPTITESTIKQQISDIQEEISVIKKRTENFLKNQKN
jgi:hypothetical protein